MTRPPLRSKPTRKSASKFDVGSSKFDVRKVFSRAARRARARRWSENFRRLWPALTTHHSPLAFLKQFLANPARRPIRNTVLSAQRIAAIETLEPRQLLATFTVMNTNDAGPDSFRAALTAAEAAGDDTIVFDTSLAGQTIQLTSDLTPEGDTNPARFGQNTGDLTIVGLTKATGGPDITIRGGAGINGLNWGSNANNDALTVQNLIMRDFSEAGAGVFSFRKALRAHGPSVTIQNSHFIDNVFSNGTGVVQITNPNGGPNTTTIEDSIFSGNSTADPSFTLGDGGALLLNQVSTGAGAFTAVIRNSLFYENSTDMDGGAIEVTGLTSGGGPVDVTITNSTIVDNTSGDGRGGIHVWGTAATVNLENTIVTGNTQDTSTDNGGTVNQTTSLVGATVNFVNAGGDDYRLAATATNAIDQGTDALATAAGLTLDLDGRLRFFDEGSVGNGGGGIVDIGAFEFNAPLPPEITIELVATGLEIPDGDTTPSGIGSEGTDFGQVETAGGMEVRTFRIRNDGGVTLTLTGPTPVTLSDATHFSVTQPTDLTLDPAQAETFTVTFDPTSDGVKNATVNVASDDSNEDPYDFAIAGEGVTTAPTNTPPTISGTVAGQMVDDNMTIQSFFDNGAVTIDDADDDALMVTVTLDVAANGTLSGGGFTNAGGGVYTLNAANPGAATTAIRALTFDPTENQVAVGNTVTTTFTIFVDDSTAPAVTDNTTTVTATSINDAPVAVDDEASTDEDTPLDVSPGNDTLDTPAGETSVLANDDDPDPGTTLSVVAFDSTSANGAAVSVAADGSFTYDPTGQFDYLASGEMATDTFTYTIRNVNPLPSSVVGYWRMEQDTNAGGGFSVPNEVGGGNPLTGSAGSVEALTGSGFADPVPQTGQANEFGLNGSANINGTVASYAALNSDSITVEMYVRSNEGDARLINRGFNSGTSGYRIHQPNGVQVQYHVDNGAGGATLVTINSGINLDSNWDHVAWTYDQASGVGRVYLNGAQVAINDGPDGRALVHSTTATLDVGTAFDGGGGFSGNTDALIDEVRISNAALPPSVLLQTPTTHTDTATVNILVNGHNDQTAATNTTQTQMYAEDSGPVAIDDIVVSDVDQNEMVTATLTLADTATGALSAGSGNGETYTPGTGVWTVSGTLAAVNAALAAVQFVPVLNNDLDTTVAVNIADGLEDSTVAVTGTITLDVTPLSDPPDAVDDGLYGSDEDNSISIPVQDGLISYVVSGGTAGTQTYGGSLGMDFDVNQAVTITELGVFDDNSDGLMQPITAHVYNRNAPATPLVTLTFTPTDAGTLEGGSRFKELATPLQLPAGFQGTIVAEGYGTNERNGNVGTGSTAGATNGGGVIDFVGSGRFGGAGSFPTSSDGGPANRYHAGTFKFSTGLLANDSDPDTGDVLSVFDFDTVSANGAAVTVNPDGSFSYDPTGSATIQALDEGAMLTDTFTYTITDGNLVPSAILNDSPINLWRLDDAALPTAADFLGGRDGTYTNFTAGELVQPGAAAGSLSAQFNTGDNNNYVAIPDDGGGPGSLNDVFSNDYTVEFWMHKESELNDWARMVGKGDLGGNDQRTFGVWEESGGGRRILYQIYTPTSSLNLFSTTQTQIGQWYHVAVTKLGATASLYINGNLEASATIPEGGVVDLDTSPLTIGRDPWRHGSFEGRLDDVALFDQALNVTQIQAHFNAGPTVLATDTATVSVLVNGINDQPDATDDANSITEAVDGVPTPNMTTGNVLTNDTDVDDIDGNQAGTTFTVTTPSASVTILSTNFDGRTVVGPTASNLTWTTVGGIADPGDVTASHDLFDTGDAQNRFAVDRNLHNEGNWTVDVPLNLGSSTIGLDGVSLDAFIYSNAGSLQPDQRDLDLQVELLDAASVVIDSDMVNNIFANSGGATQPQAVSFDLSGNILTAGASYTLRITASGTGPGNNAGFDNLDVTGIVGGLYGVLDLGADGSYTYTLDDNNPTVQALLPGDTLADTFNYTMSDNHPQGNAKTDSADLTIIINGANDSPTATNNTAAVTEDGGAAQMDTGNVITDDDGNGEDSGDPDNVQADLVVTDIGGVTDPGTNVSGIYGSLDWDSDGSYTYTLNNTLPAVQQLQTGESPSDTFTYTLQDTITGTTIGTFTGSDPGEGLDFSGNFVYAVNVGQSVTVGQNIGDAIFTDDTGLVSAQNQVQNWLDANFDGGDGGSNGGAEGPLEKVMESIRWSAAPNNVDVTLPGLVAGNVYKLQLLFGESCCNNRGFDVLAEGSTIASAFSPGTVGGGSGAARTQGAVITHIFVAGDDTLNVVLDQDSSAATTDNNPILNAFTLEQLPASVKTDTATLEVTVNGLDEETEVSIDTSGNLVVTDVDGGNSDDRWKVSVDASGVITIEDLDNKQIQLDHTPGSAVVGTGDATDTVTIDPAQNPTFMQHIIFNTLAGNDELTVDYSTGQFNNLIEFNGGDPSLPTTPGDKLIVTGGTFNSMTDNLTGPGMGNIDLESDNTIEITYTGLEPVDETGLTVPNRVFNLPAGVPDAVLENYLGTSDDFSRIRSVSAAFEEIRFKSPSNSLTINSAGGSSFVSLALMDTMFAPDSMRFNGPAGDEFELSASDIIPNTTDVTLDGGATLDVQAFTDTINGLTLNDGIVDGSGTISAVGNSYLLRSGTVNANLAGSVALRKLTAATVLLTGANAYAAGATTTIEEGTLQVQGGAAIPDNSIVQLNGIGGAGVFDLDGSSETIGGLSGVSSGSVTLGGGQLTIQYNSGSPVTFAGAINEGGAVVKTGSGTQILTGTNTYAGTTDVNDGTLQVDGSTATGNAVTVNIGGTLAGQGTVGGSVTLVPLVMQNLVERFEADAITGVANGATFAAWNDAALGDATAQNAAAGGNPTYQQNVANGHAVVRFDGNDEFRTSDSPGIGPMDGFAYFAVVRANGTPDNGATNNGSGDYIIDRNISGFSGNPLVSLKAVAGRFGYQTRYDNGSGLGGPVSTTAISQTDFQIVAMRRNTAAGRFEIWVDGAMEAMTADNGTALTPSPINIGRHATDVNGGFNGDIAELLVYDDELSPDDFNQVGAYLAGKYGLTTSFSATISPGTSDGADVGMLSTGDLTANAPSSYEVQLDGLNPGNTASDHDQLVVTGTVTLNGATLSPTAAVAPTVGHAYVIIDNDGTADAVSGTFDGLPEGATVTASGQGFTISYVGGDGNDVVLFGGAAETEVSIDGGGNLVVKDINGGVSDDDLTISYDGTYFTIQDANLNLITSGIASGDLLRPDARTVRVLATAVTGGLTLDLFGGTDQTDVTSVLPLAGNVSLNQADDINLPGGGGLNLGGGNIVWVAGTNVLNVNGGAVSNLGAITETAGNNTINYDSGTLGAGGENITVDDFNIANVATYTRSGGTLAVNNNLRVGGTGGNADRGTLIQNSGAVTVGNDLLFGGDTAGSGSISLYDLNGGTLMVTGNAEQTTLAAVRGHLYVDEPNALTVTGDITIQSFRTGDDQPGSYTVPGGQTVITTGTLLVGNTAQGTLIVDGGAVVAANATVSDTTGSAGSTFTLQNNATANINGTFDIGDQANGDGTVNVNSGSMITVTGQTQVGNTGKGVLNLNSGTGHSFAAIVLGDDNNANAVGEMNVDIGAANTVAVNGLLQVGNAGKGTLNLTTGTMSVTAGGVRLADSAQATGARAATVVIGTPGGSGSADPILNVSGGNTEVADNGEGTITIHNGRFNQLTNNVVVGQQASSNATFRVNDGLVDLVDDLNIANQGTGLVEINGGTVNVGRNVQLASTTTGDSDADIVMNDGIFNIGDRVDGNLRIGRDGRAGSTADVAILGGIVNISGFSGGSDPNQRGTIILGEIAGSSATLTVGDGTTGNNPLINLNVAVGTNPASTGNFETAMRGTGDFIFKSGTITQNDNNWITGQNVGSEANVEIGGFDAAANLNLTGGDGLRDWNTNGGHGSVDVLENGFVRVGRNINLGNSTDADSGLELSIDGGTVRVGADGTSPGDIDFRDNGPQDEITLVDGLLQSNHGTIHLSNRAGTTDDQFSMIGGTLENFGTFNGTLNQDDGTLQIGFDGTASDMTVNGDYNLGAPAIFDIDILGTAGAGVAGGYDQLVVNGTVDLGGSPGGTLDLSYDIVAGNGPFVIINNNLTDPVTGRFENPDVPGDALEDGETITVETGTLKFPLRIEYDFDAGGGGDNNLGNDVALLFDPNVIVPATPGDDEVLIRTDSTGTLIEIYINDPGIDIVGGDLEPSSDLPSNPNLFLKVPLTQMLGGSVTWNALAGADKLGVDYADGTFFESAAHLPFNLDFGGEGGDFMLLTSADATGTPVTTAFSAETYTIGPAANAGTFEFTDTNGTQTISFARLSAHIDDEVDIPASGTVTVNASADSNGITLENSPSTSGPINMSDYRVSFSDGFTGIDLREKPNLTVDGRGLNDTFNINDSNPVALFTTLLGNSGTDQFVFADGVVLTGTIDGGSGNDTIDWSSYTTARTIQLTGLGTVDGFTGNDASPLTSISPVVVDSFDNIDILLGTGQSDTLRGADLRTHWDIAGNDGVVVADEGDLSLTGNDSEIGRPTGPVPIAANAAGEEDLAYTSFESLVGGSDDDRFDLRDGAVVSGTIDGGASGLQGDSLDYRDFTATAVTVILTTGAATNVGGNLVAGGSGDEGSSIENVFGGDADDTITGDPDDNILGDGFGSDALSGDEGDDTLRLEPGEATTGSSNVLSVDFNDRGAPGAGSTEVGFSEFLIGGTENNDLTTATTRSFGSIDVTISHSNGGAYGDRRRSQPVDSGGFTDDQLLRDFVFFRGTTPNDGTNVLIEGLAPGGHYQGRIWSFDDGSAPARTSDWFVNGTLVADNYSFDGNSVPPSPPNNDTYAFDFNTTADSNGEILIEGRWVGGTCCSVFLDALSLDRPGPAGGSTDTVNDEGGNDTLDFRFASQADAIAYPTTGGNIDGVVIDMDLVGIAQDVQLFGGNASTLQLNYTTAQAMLNPDPVSPFENFVGSQFNDFVDIVVLHTDEDGNPVVRNVDGNSPVLADGAPAVPPGDTLAIDGQGQVVKDSGFSIVVEGVGTLTYQSIENLVLYNRRAQVVDNGEEGFSTSPVATTALGNWKEIQVAASTQTAARLLGDSFDRDLLVSEPESAVSTGLNTAEWAFDGLSPGLYRVSMTWPQDDSLASNVPLTIFENGAEVISTTVDQRSGADDFVESGEDWEVLGFVRISSDQSDGIRVQLTNQANGRVFADAVRVDRFNDGPELQVLIDNNVELNDPASLQLDTRQGQPVTKTFTVQNAGSSTLEVNEISLVNDTDFTRDLGPALTVPFSLAPSASTTFRVTLSADTAGDFTDQIRIFSNDLDEGVMQKPGFNPADPLQDVDPFTVDLSGTVSNTLIIDDEDVGYNSGGFTEFGVDRGQPAQGLHGDMEYSQGGSGSDVATWTFNNLVAGATYKISVTWPERPNRAADAPFTVFDGSVGSSNQAAMLTLDQRQRPDAAALAVTPTPLTFTEDEGVFWADLATFAPSGSTITVQLTDSIVNKSQYVIADAVRAELVESDPDVRLEVGGDEVPDDTGAVDFGTLFPGQSAVRSFTISNSSSMTNDIMLGATLSLPVGFTLENPSPSTLFDGTTITTLTPGDPVTFDLRMTGGALGQLGGPVSFAAGGDPDENPFNFLVSGQLSATRIVDNGTPATNPADVTPADYNGTYSEGLTQPWSGPDGDGYRGDDRFVAASATSTPTAEAVWTFNDLPGGYYQVFATYSEEPFQGGATAAPYELMGTGGSATTVTVNQKRPPSDLHEDGVGWRQLGGPLQVDASTATAADGVLTVRLTNPASAGGFVHADGVMIKRLESPEIELTDVTGTPLAVADGGTVNFGDQHSVGDMVQRTFQIRNLGRQNLLLGAPSALDRFSLGGFPLSVPADDLSTAAAENVATFTITLDTSTNGIFREQLSFLNADLNETPFDVTLDAAVGALIVDDGDAEHATTGTWVEELFKGFDGHLLYNQKVGGAEETSTWSFPTVPEGRYRVLASFPAQSNLATDAPYTISAGAAGSVTAPSPFSLMPEINQRLGANDFSFIGTGWEQLSIVDVSNSGSDGSLTVTLSSLGADNFVFADAIMLLPITGPEIVLTDITGGGVGVANGGAVDLGTTLTRTFEIRNVGVTDLILGGPLPTLPADFSVSMTSPFDPFAGPIGSDVAATFQLQYDGSLPGTFGGQVSIDSNDADDNPFAFDVTASVAEAVTIIDNKDPATAFMQSGFTEFGQFTGNLPQGFRGTIHYAQGGSPTDTATWTFSGLAAGIYNVSATWHPGANRATNAPFTLAGGMSPETVRINQQLAPDDFSDEGVFWENLGGVQLTGTMLTVTLSNAGISSSKYVIADAIRIEPLLTPEIEVAWVGPDGTPNSGDEVLLGDGGSFDFGTTASNVEVERTFQVKNTGGGALQLSNLDVGDGFVVTSGFSNTSLGHFDSTSPSTISSTLSTFSVEFSAAAEGVTVAELTFDNNDPDEGPFNFDVSGRVNVGGTFIIDDGNEGWSGPRFATFAPQGFADESDHVSDIHFSQVGSGRTASWTFDNLVEGSYRVSVTYPATANRSTAAPFSVYDGDAMSGTLRTALPVRINQQQAPGDFFDRGVFWEDLGGFEVTEANGNQLTVTLTDITGVAGELDVKYVIADAIRIERVDPQQPEIDVLGSGGGIVNNEVIVLSNVEIGEAVTETITIQNSGTGQLNLGMISIVPGGDTQFTLDTTGTDLTLPAGQSTSFDVLLDTSVASPSPYMVTVRIPSNDGDENPFDFTVQATVDALASLANVTIIDNGDVGFSAPSFTRFGPPNNPPQGYQGDIHYYAPATGGLAAATWTFDNLDPGTYQVAVTWHPGPNRANDSPFTLAGATTAGTVHLNQRLAPSAFAGAIMQNGVYWAPLDLGGNGGNFTINSGTLTVSLGTSPRGYVIADAVRIEKLPPLLTEAAVVSGQWSVDSDRSSVISGRSSVISGQRPAVGLDSSAGNARSLGAEVSEALETARALWAAADPSSSALLAGVTVQVANLPGNVLGLASEHQGRIWLDADAAGYGWNVSQETRDKSQEPDGAFTPSPTHPITPSSFDLLTVVSHELGHVLGLPDLDAELHPHDLMSSHLAAGVQRLPTGIEIAPDSGAALQPALQPAALVSALVSTDRLFADLGGSWGGEADDELSGIDRDRRDGMTFPVQRDLEEGSLAAETDRLLDDDDDEDLFADRDEHRTDRRDEESADQLFAELFDEL